MLRACKATLLILLGLYAPAELTRLIVIDGWKWYHFIEVPLFWGMIMLEIYLLTRWLDDDKV